MMDFSDILPTEDACLEYLALMRWPDGYACLRCDSKNVSKIRSGYWRCRECRYRGSVIFNTLFQDTHKPLRLWFEAMWYVVNQKSGVSALGLQKALGLGSYQTAWEWLHKACRSRECAFHVHSLPCAAHLLTAHATPAQPYSPAQKRSSASLAIPRILLHFQNNGCFLIIVIEAIARE
jgi:transposase-like protein